MFKLHHGNCLDLMPKIPDGSIDMVLVDPPYGTTSCKWDTVIDLDKMWEQLKRIVKPNGAIVIFGSEPFSSVLRLSNLEMFKYDWIWEKCKPSNFMLANKQPLKYHEILSIFYKKQCTYNKQFWYTKPMNTVYRQCGADENSVIGKNKSIKAKELNSKKRNPKSIIKIPEVIGNSKEKAEGKHPTQKPVALIEYLLKTYTKENDLVLDFAMGSATTGVGCIKLSRNFIGMEIEKEIFETAKKRLCKTYECCR